MAGRWRALARPVRRPWTLRSRLVAALLLLSALGLAVVGVANVLLLRQSLLSRVDQQLVGVSQPWVAGPGARPPPRYGAKPVLPTNFRVTVLEPNGTVDRVLGQSPGMGGPVLPVPRTPITALVGAEPFTVRDDGGGSAWRVRVVHAAGGDVVAVSLSLADSDAAVNHLIVIELAAGAVVLALLGVVATLVVRLGLRPLTRITETAGAIARGELDRRVEGTGDHTEAGRLATALNTMLGRVAGALDERARSEQRLRRFVADASHELRTPLTSIRGFAELYRRGGAPDEGDLARLMSRIEGEAGRMGRLVEDLLLLARLDEERALDLTDVDLLVLAGDAVQAARARQPDRPVTLAAPGGPQRVLGDEHRLRQVITNLVGNALVHTPAGTPVRVTVGRRDPAGRPPMAPIATTGPLATDGPAALVEVSDAGPGVPADRAHRLFDRFYRLDAGRTGLADGGGTGLGLAIAAAIVEAHRGRIELLSAPGAGARFRVLLPIG